jgi:hypothetical protein
MSLMARRPDQQQRHDGVQSNARPQQQAPQVPVVWGGYHATQAYRAILAEGWADYVIRGPGEEAITALAGLLGDGWDRSTLPSRLETVPNLVYRQGSQIVVNPYRMLTSFDDLPPLDYGLIEVPRYFTEAHRYIQYISSYGCPHACTFCAEPTQSLRRWRGRGAARFVDEVCGLWQRYHPNKIYVVDPNFSSNPRRVVDIVNELEARRADIDLFCDMRAGDVLRIAREMPLAKLREVGFREIFIGLKSGSDRMLRLLKKNLRAADGLAACRMLDEADAIVGEVARRFGGGKYLARFFSEEGLLERAPVRFGIAASVKPQPDEEQRTTRSTGNTLQERLLEKMLEKAVDGGGNAGSVTAAMINAGSQQAAAMMGVLMPMMKQMMENAQPQRLPAEVMADMFSAGLEFAGKGGGDDRSPLALIDRFAGILEKATGARRALAAPTPQAQAPQAATPAAPTPAIERKPMPGWLKLLQPYLAELVQAANDGTPASLVAAVIADRSPSVADWLAAQTPSVFIEAVSEHVPELKPHAEWMNEVLTALRDGESNGDTPDGTVPHDA